VKRSEQKLKKALKTLEILALSRLFRLVGEAGFGKDKYIDISRGFGVLTFF
jgi:hypothetical protein